MPETASQTPAGHHSDEDEDGQEPDDSNFGPRVGPAAAGSDSVSHDPLFGGSDSVSHAPSLDDEDDNEAIIDAEEREAIRRQLDKAHREKRRQGPRLLHTEPYPKPHFCPHSYPNPHPHLTSLSSSPPPSPYLTLTFISPVILTFTLPVALTFTSPVTLLRKTGGHCVTYNLNSTIKSWVYVSQDGGETWHMGTPAPLVGAGEPMVVELPDGRLLMNARPLQWPHDGQPHPDRQRLYAVSNDGGQTWVQVPPGQLAVLPGPSCEAAFIRSDNELLFANPNSNIQRVNMTLRVSRDWGITWRSTLVYPNSSWYSGLTVVQQGLDPRKVLVAFVKDCNESLRIWRGANERSSDRYDVTVGAGVISGVSVECAGISIWTHTLNDI